MSKNIFYSDKPFNGDHNIEKEILRLKKAYKLTLAVETGTYLGYTTLWFSKNFEKAISIDIKPNTSLEVKKELIKKNNFKLYAGDSSKHLKTILQGINDNMLIYLDAHWYGSWPILDELDQIAEIGIKPVIVIHDFFVPNNKNLGYDTYKGQKLDFEYIKPSVKKIYGNSGYQYYYNSKYSGAKRGVIYITQKN
jgi:hypothetical protein